MAAVVLARRWPWAVVLLCAAAAAWAAAARAGRRDRPLLLAPVASIRTDEYVTSDACRSCHPGAYATWHRTFHRTMTQPATAAAIVGTFDGSAVDPQGRVRTGRDRDRFWVEILGPEGPRRHDVVMVTGSHHMQVYWVRGDAGRLVAFDHAFLIDEGRWTPNDATLLRPPAADVTYTWNRVCIKCHAVAGVPGFDPDTFSVTSGVAELGIACEACHGPAHEHGQAHRNPLSRYRARLSDDPDPTIVHPARLSADAASQICAQCHAITVFDDDERWVQRGHDATPPDPIEAWGHLVRHPLRADQAFADPLLDEDPDYFAGRFWYDGMVRVSGREYNGLVESACAVSPDFGCLSCHGMHGPAADDQLALADPDDACRDCHLAITTQGAAHTHHAPESSGSRCVNCHMPHTTYGLLKAIRSHQIGSPNVTEDEAAGRPNACNLCHLDRSLAWAADRLGAWYGQGAFVPNGPLDAEPSAGTRWLLAGDAGQRALLAWHFGWAPAVEASGPGWQAPLLAQLLDDPYAAVRWVALRALRRLPPTDAGWPPDPLAVTRAEIEAMTVGTTFDRDRAERLRAARDERPISLAE